MSEWETEKAMQKVSLLVTTYNASENLRVTFQSILEQDYDNLEVVIADGGSEDGTVELIREFADRQSAGRLDVQWVSEPDEGLYDAMNKAFHRSTGEIVAVCNDRLYRPDAVSKLVCAIQDGGSACVGAHADLIYEEAGRVVRRWHMGEGKLSDGWMPGHPTLFLKREIYERYGGYDTSYRCAADYEFMVRFLKEDDCRLAYVPEILVSMFYGGTSNAGLSNYLLSFREGYRALRKNGIRHPFLITLRRTLRVLRQF